MTTSMADPLDFGEQQRFDQLHHQQLEQKLFNTGPRASRTLPTATSQNLPSGDGSASLPLVCPSDVALQPFNEDSVDGQMRVFTAPLVNECSNLSSAGSISDREPDGTPGRCNRPGIEKKSIRKRRRGDETPKSERKITDFIRGQTSPKRFAVNSNGDNCVNDIAALGGSTGVRWMTSSPTLSSRITPTNPHYSSDSNSNSNQSPPTPAASTRLRNDCETQTDFDELNPAPPEEIAKRDRLIQELRSQLIEEQNRTANERRKNESAKEALKRLLIENSVWPNTMERKAIRDKTTENTPRIGQYKLVRHGDSFREIWVDGWAQEELDKKMQQIANERNEIANASALLKKRKPVGIAKEGTTPKRSAANSLSAQLAAIQTDGSIPSTSSGDDAVFRRPEEPKEINYQEYIELDEIYKLRREHMKKEELEVIAEKEKLDRERQLHLRELKRASNERDSRYKDHEMLNKRYLLLSLLGKGGFSEVWRAFDLEENRFVACKIHHVNKEWKEEKKANYVKHAMREKDIHKTLDHCRIVKLFDLFTIDNHSFCTVLEYCTGNDLDFYLKQNKCISEKEARSIIMQVVSALVYLNEKKPPIIHYDLKPANILLESGTTCGAIKITDFGLSKIMEGSSDDDSIELTSQFAGTYWYLPPETFVVSHAPPKISSKVDVWSVGVIFYQCIYGKKPFGNDQTQQKILEENTILKANEVHFPAKPQVSHVAQDFIRRCLQYKKEDRADVFELMKHELFRPRGQKSGPPSSPSISRSLSKGEVDE
ncbi:Mixed lineage protein kinase [Trichostrongylus colubriformis]|uniref:Mixed lineage protein kinase n=1 Tax=Trichostrongylus colubriformis TaxID=6319 RepID=A0AAN8ENZ0_TRICO